ncbi:MAG: YHYH protein [Chthoniobacteraceae bacterium]
MRRPFIILFAATALAALPGSRVTTLESDGFRTIRSNGLPDHTPGEFPRRGNPNRISEQDYTFRVPLKPREAEKPVAASFSFFAVALNGVPFEPGTAEFWEGDRAWNYEAKTGFTDLGLDEHNAHVQPNGAYHYHGLPTGLIERLGGDGKKMLLIGYAADGFPLYTPQGHADAKDAASPLRRMRPSFQLKKGTRPDGPGGAYDGKFTADFEYVAGSGDLDDCNGRFGVTPEFPEGIYHYYITGEFPFIGRQWHGVPDESFQKRRGPGPPFDGFGPPGRRPPPPRR